MSAADVTETLRGDPHYLDRCQHDTPATLVSLAWEQVAARRDTTCSVVDFGAGDGRFALTGRYRQYLGYEIDARRIGSVATSDARIIANCAFSHFDQSADLCIGNPPFVRNQDLPAGWRAMAAAEVRKRTGVRLSGLANAWQYFLMLALWSVKSDGLVVQIVPFEWVYRPAAIGLRDFIAANGWGVDVYRLPDGTFDDVLTSASITVIDKAGDGTWNYHQMGPDGSSTQLLSPTGTGSGVLAYTTVRESDSPVAKRGLSPGTQKALTLTEGERIHAGLRIGTDVLKCVTSLRGLPATVEDLDEVAFRNFFIDQGRKCWLVRTDTLPSPRLRRYLDSVDPAIYQTATCLAREDWWRFVMPSVPAGLISQTFKATTSPKAVVNSVSARAVGGISGVFNLDMEATRKLIQHIRSSELNGLVVEYASGLRKLEINQLNTLIAKWGQGALENG